MLVRCVSPKFIDNAGRQGLRRAGGARTRICALGRGPKRDGAAILALLSASVVLAGCSFGSSAPDPNLGVAASPRVSSGGRVPKGGGVYKVGKPYKVAGRWYVPQEVSHYDRTGIASWYGAAFHGRRTANGEIYDMNALTAGHPTLPLPSYAYVTNLNNGRTILVRVNDRGPYVGNRLIDLSRRSATELGFKGHGLARVRVRYAGRAPLNGDDWRERQHLAAQSWTSPGRAYANRSSSQISTGAIALGGPPAAPEPQWSVTRYRQQLRDGGRGREEGASVTASQRQHLTVGPFASLAEAERMHHELEELGPATVERIGAAADPSYRVLVGPLNDPAAVAAAQEMAGLAPGDGAFERVDGSR